MIRVIAIVLMGSGALMFLGRIGSYANAPLILRESAAVAGTGIALLIAGQLAVPILKIATGYGLYRLKRRAWPAALIVLGMDVVTLGVSILRFRGIGMNASGGGPSAAEGNEIVQTSSILPLYVVAVLSFASLVVMCSKPVRKSWQDRSGAA